MDSCQMCTIWDAEPDLRIAELDQCYVVLNRDQFFTGYTFVFSKEHVTELFHLDRETRSAVMEEVTATAAALNRQFKADKINYELLGNMVPHMHWHLVPRLHTDRLWPRPIWAEPHEEVILSPADYAERIELIRKALIA
ncbi:MAG TPA: HIT family protein [Geobacteraceae bacterium]|nr:HIT family protein [Geobacteraceae bacterium]